MRMKLAEQSLCGILNSLIARLLLEDEQEGLAILFNGPASGGGRRAVGTGHRRYGSLNRANFAGA
jgi:hypothetical protein